MERVFEVRFSGVQVFAFPDPEPSKGHALLVRSGEGEAVHNPLLSYFVKNVSNGSRPVPDEIFIDPRGRAIAHRRLENEILKIEPIWGDSADPRPLTVEQAPDDADTGSDEARSQRWLDHTAVLSKIDGRIVPPDDKNRAKGIRKECLDGQLADSSPCTARVDFEHGHLSCGPIQDNVKWIFAHPGGQSLSSAPKQWLARWVGLEISGTKGVRISSDRRGDLVFSRFGSQDKRIVVSISNEPRSDRDFSGGSDTEGAHASSGHGGGTGRGPTGLELIPHFPMLYNVVNWNQRVQGSATPLAAIKDPGEFRTIEDKICPTATFALPRS